MQIRLGEHLQTRDEQDAGVVDKVIVDPNNGQVTTVVLRQGGLLHHDVEVALSQIESGPGGQPRINLSAQALADLPRFHEANYTTIPSDVTVPIAYPYETVLWPIASTPVPMVDESPPYGERGVEEEVAARLYNADLNNAIVGPGSGVYSADGHKVGEVERFSFDQTGRLDRLVVRQGFLFPHEHALPGGLVGSAADGKLYLTVDQAKLKEVFHLE